MIVHIVAFAFDVVVTSVLIETRIHRKEFRNARHGQRDGAREYECHPQKGERASEPTLSSVAYQASTLVCRIL
jgi:hypothetical protein